MKISFTHAYYSLIKLKNKDSNKVCFLTSTHLNRIKQLVDFFEWHSNCSVKRFSLAKLASIISPDGKTMKSDVKTSVAHYLRKSRPEYIVLEDYGDLPKNFTLMDELCDMIRRVGEKTAVIVVTEYAAEFSILYGEAVMVNVIGLNENSLKIRTSKLQTEELYLHNRCEAVSSGVFWANKDFYDSFLANKILGDRLFAQEDYKGAFEKYNNAISFHAKFDNDECLINDFLSMTLFVRCIACFLYGKWPEKNDAIKYMKEGVNSIMLKLKKSEMCELHGKMLKDYDLIFLGVKDGWLEKNNYLLFLNEYIF